VRTAEPTSSHQPAAEVYHLAVWRFLATVEVKSKSSSAVSPPEMVWEQVRRAAAPGPAHLYVPAFTLSRVTVQQIGTSLVRAQPVLSLRPGLPAELRGPTRLIPVSRNVHALPPRARPAVNREGRGVAGGVGQQAAPGVGPGFADLSPVLLTEEDAHAVAHFVYLALESRESPDLRSIDYDLALTGAQLVFLPAVYDLRHVRDSNWRILLEELDG
jgi:hypothetical protein